MCIGAMFSINVFLALIALLIFLVCFYCIKFFGGIQEWGAGVRGLALSFATQSLIRISKVYGQTRYWRPQILHIINLKKTKLTQKKKSKSTAEELEDTGVTAVGGHKDDKQKQEKSNASNRESEHETVEWKVKRSDIQLFNLGAQIKQGSGLAIGGCVLTIDSKAKVAIINKLKQMIQQTMRKQDLDGLAEICVSPDMNIQNLITATMNLVQLTGLGTLRPNTLMINFPKRSNKQEYEIFKKVLEQAVAYEMAVIVPVGGVRIWDGVHGSKEKGYIDIG